MLSISSLPLAFGLLTFGVAVLVVVSVRAVRASRDEAAARLAASAASAAKRSPKAESTTVSPVTESLPPLPRIAYDEDDAELDPTKVSFSLELGPPSAPAKIIHDEDAEDDHPTSPNALFLLAATAQTDRGIRRKRNEDSVLVLEEHTLYVVADGMGGHRGGEVASQLAVSTMERAFATGEFGHGASDALPRRAAELARSIELANDAIRARAGADGLKGMGTTICAARFCPTKHRLYIGHVGDSRAYRLRTNELERMTTDHTFGELGVTGSSASLLSRAVGVAPTVPVDVVFGKPAPGDVYLFCSDGLNKMISDEDIRQILCREAPPENLARDLVELANARGGRDNVTVIVVSVREPRTSLSAA